MKTPIFTGSGVALVTPITKDGVDFDKLAELIEFHIANKTDALIVCGTTGEASTMPDDEHKEVMRRSVEIAAGRIPIIVGTGSNDTAHAVDFSQYAEKVGADGVLVVTPYYNKTTQHGLYIHTKTIADSINIPIILYNVPSRTGLGFTVETLKKVDEIPNINAIKEASGDIGFMAGIAAETDLVIYSGNDDMIVPCLSLGGKGVISVMANIAPRETHDICEKYFNGDTDGSRDMFLKYLKLARTLFIEVNPVPVKTAMNLLGYNVGIFRLPLCDMLPENLVKLENVLTEYGLKNNDIIE